MQRLRFLERLEPVSLVCDLALEPRKPQPHSVIDIWKEKMTMKKNPGRRDRRQMRKNNRTRWSEKKSAINERKLLLFRKASPMLLSDLPCKLNPAGSKLRLPFAFR